METRVIDPQRAHSSAGLLIRKRGQNIDNDTGRKRLLHSYQFLEMSRLMVQDKKKNNVVRHKKLTSIPCNNFDIDFCRTALMSKCIF